MTSYLLVTLTFALGLIGSLFDVRQKDDAGNVIRGMAGLPKLTGPGSVSVLLLVLSFAFTLVATFKANKEAADANQKASQMQSDLAASRVELTHANTSITNLSNEDFQQFSSVGRSLRDTGDQVSKQLHKATGDIQAAVDQSSVDLDQNIVGSVTNLSTLKLDVFFVGLQHLHKPGDPTALDSLVEIKEIACHAPFPISMSFMIPIARNPELTLTINAEKHDGDCVSNVYIGTVAPSLNGLSAKTDLWPEVDYRNPCDITEYVGDFKSDAFKSFASKLSLTAAAFRPAGSVTIYTQTINPSDFNQLGPYLISHLPRVMGFHAIPNGRNDLAVQSAFAVDSYSISGNAIYVYYSQTAVRPNWSSWDFSGLQLFQTHALPNPYRTNAPPTSVFGVHLSRAEADLWGKRCPATHPAP